MNTYQNASWKSPDQPSFQSTGQNSIDGEVMLSIHKYMTNLINSQSSTAPFEEEMIHISD